MKGKEILKVTIYNAPSSPGVYKIHNHNNEIIYIGKAKNLKNRLQQYLISTSIKNHLLQNELSFINYEITDSESSALILESDLIKIFKPKYNILLKDDKSFPFILI
ncbi:MAG: GIY-YIG nuclease family protein [Rickettsia sp.]|nr:GIY-YIG nuclease family protein [Rickettsia sp.]